MRVRLATKEPALISLAARSGQLAHGEAKPASAKTADTGSTHVVLACGGQLHHGAILLLPTRLAQLRLDALAHLC